MIAATASQPSHSQRPRCCIDNHLCAVLVRIVRASKKGSREAFDAEATTKRIYNLAREVLYGESLPVHDWVAEILETLCQIQSSTIIFDYHSICASESISSFVRGFSRRSHDLSRSLIIGCACF